MAKSGDDDEARRFYQNRLQWMQAVLADKAMPERYKLVAISIVLRINPPSYLSFPEMGTVAKDTNVSKSTVIRATKYLETHKWLYVHRYGNKANSTGRAANRYSMMLSASK